MLRFSFFGFPVIIHWFFWLSLALLGGVASLSGPEDVQRLLAWVAAGALSIFIHEMGHALTMHHYGARQVHIVLHGFGGYAICEKRFSRVENFFVSFAGPFVQLAAGVALWWVLDAVQPAKGTPTWDFIGSFVNVSIFWAVLNLFPILPLDGGHIMQAVLGPRRQKITLIISLVCAAGFALFALTLMQIFITVFFGLFAYNNWKQLKGEQPTMMP